MERVFRLRDWRALLTAVMLATMAIASPPEARATGGTLKVCLSQAPFTPREAFANPARFDCAKPQTAWGPGDFWVLSRPLSVAGREKLLVRQYGVWQTRTRVWASYADGRVLPLHRARNSGSIGTSIEHVLPARDAASVRLLWRVEGAANTRGIVLGVRLTTIAEQAARNASTGMMVGWFAGLCVGFLFINTVLWLALRRQFQAAYCAMVSGLLLYVATDAGMVRRHLPLLDETFELKLTSLTFTLCVVGGLWFARCFLEPEVVGARLKRCNQAVGAIMVGAAIVQAALPPSAMRWIDAPQGGAFLLAFVMLVALAWRAWTQPSAFRWVWSATAIVPALLAGMRAANSFPILGTVFAMGDRLLALMAAAMFASSLAIAYRIHLMAKERDTARAKQIAAQLLADTDPLTGMLNRRAFMRQAIGREGDQVLMLADIDHFKRVNETIGHDGGDEVLRAIARALEAAVPPGALAARIGGEEFAILAPVGVALDPNDILDQVRAARMPYDLAVTASIGLCNGPLARETDWKALYRDADRALFAAKSAGRDRVRRAPPSATALAAAA